MGLRLCMPAFTSRDRLEATGFGSRSLGSDIFHRKERIHGINSKLSVTIIRNEVR